MSRILVIDDDAAVCESMQRMLSAAGYTVQTAASGEEGLAMGRGGAVAFVQKPFFRDELLMRVRAAAERRQLARQVDLLQRHIRPGGTLEALVGTSPAVV